MSTATRKRAVVTGGGTGLGRASAIALLAQGYEVISLGIDREDDTPLERLDHRVFDVTDCAAIQDFAAGLDELDLLVNAAGIIMPDGAELTAEGFARVIDVNLTGTRSMCFACEAALEARGGSVVNFASMWSIFGSARNPAYSASKGAVVSLTRALAANWGPRGMRANAVAPGWIETRLSQNAMNDPERSENIMARIPMARWGVPAEIGSVVVFLASPAASYVNGIVLPVDGGYAIA
ncbi:MAG: SDR family oxidoreductase [Roseovarius sp.]|nr:SDR family oxidoreductase [Roseovarius sp.]